MRSWAGKKWVLVPDASTCTVVDREPPLKTFRSADSFAVTSECRRCTHESKPVMLAVKIPFAIVLTAVEVSRVERCLYATGLGLGWALNIASCWVPFDAKSRSNDSMSVDGGSQSKEKYRNNK
jgi:hypothetical protein